MAEELPDIRYRPAAGRGRSHTDWLDGAHSFSFADYQDPEAMGFGNLCVINDLIGPAAGFSMHPHRDMEIITYVLSGRQEHRDSMGNSSIIGAGDVGASLRLHHALAAEVPSSIWRRQRPARRGGEDYARPPAVGPDGPSGTPRQRGRKRPACR